VPALDGVRGIAILLVMLGHSWQMPKTSLPDRVASFFVSIGWSGVELFFVLSGFLITGILLDSKGRRHYFRNFYVRRVLRIFPLYYALLAFTFVAAALLPHLVGRNLGNANGQQLWYLFHLSNFSMAAHGNFAGEPLGVTWSLAVEEQFYVAWPFVVWLLPRRWLLSLCMALVLLSFACRALLLAAHVDSTVVYLLTPSQLGGIAIGGAFAIVLRSRGGIRQLGPWARWMLVGAPLLVVAIALAATPARFLVDPFSPLLDPASRLMDPTNPMMDSLGMLVVQLVGAAMIVVALSGKPLPRFVRLLETRPLRAFGRWSYAMYLMHTPVIFVIYFGGLRHGWPHLLGSTLPVQLLFSAICIGVTVAFAALSWRFYEKPILGLKRLFPVGEERRPARGTARVDDESAAA
jgi:peptidoglycan/LPS O-acetylase OafA/YrhL